MAVSMIRTALGISHNKTALSTWTIQGGMQVCAQATLILTIAHDPGSATGAVWNGQALTNQVSNRRAGFIEGSIWTLLSNPTSGAGTITVSWAGQAVTAKAAVMTQITGVTAVSGTKTGNGDSTVISTGSTGTISNTHYIAAGMGIEGVSASRSTGVWQLDANQQGQWRATSGGGGTTNIVIDEGYAVSQPGGVARSARFSSIIANDWVGMGWSSC